MFTSARRLRLLPLLVLLLCLIVPGALADTEGSYTYWIDDTLGGAVITGYTGTAANVIVPGTLGGQPVVSMGYGCLQSNAYAVTVTLPDSLRVLDGGAFVECSSLQAVYLPANLTAFTNCGDSGFHYVVGRSTATARLMSNPAGSVPNNRFVDPDWPDYKLCYFTNEAPGTAELGIALYIGSNTVVTIPDGVVRIGQYAFANIMHNPICGELTSVTLPDSVTALDRGAFYGTYALKTVTLSSNISSWGDNLFGQDRSSYPILYCDPDSVTARTMTASACPQGYTDPADPDWSWLDGGRTLGRYTGAAEHITLPDSVTAISSGAFTEALQLKAIYLPDNISAWGDNLFGQYRNEYPILYCAPDSTTVRTMTASTCPQGYTDPANPDWSWAVGSGKVLTGYHGSATRLRLPDGITGIGDRAFYDNRTLTSITVPDSVHSIGAYAFNVDYESYAGNESAYSKLDVYLPDGITSAGGCLSQPERTTFHFSLDSQTADAIIAGALDSSDICHVDDDASPDWHWTLTKDGPYYRGYTGSNLSIDVPAIAKGACGFGSTPAIYGKRQLITAIRLPEGLTTIREFAFSICGSLESIVLPSTLTTIGWSAFSYCRALTHLEIPEGVTALPDGMCYNCGSLTRITLPDSVTSIADNAFGGCPLKTVYCNPGSYAAQWASSKKLTVMPPTSASSQLIIPDNGNTFFQVGELYDWRMNTAIVPPPDIPYTLNVTSSNPNVVAVEGDMLRVLSSNRVKLTFTCPELGLTKSQEYAAFYPVEDFSLNKAYYVKQGNAITFKPLNLVPASNAYMAFFWACGNAGSHSTESESNRLVLSASDVSRLGLGIHALTATSASGVTRSSKLVVYKTLGTPTFAPFTGEYWPGMTVYPHITVTLDGTAYEDDPGFYTLTSSDSRVAVPTEDGGLRLLAPGTATITAALPGGASLKQTIAVDDVSVFTLPASLTRLEDQALAGCPAAIVVLPDGCLSIGAGAFAGCQALERIEIPASVTSIADDAFSGCNLTGLTIVTPAGSYAEAWAAGRGIAVLNE